MRAALEGLIRKQGWEADALALQGYMRGLFAEKLEAQAADIAAAGMASLEDFLLQVEERTSISWMAVPEPDKKTPSSGLPMTPPFGSRVLDDGPTPREVRRDLRTAADTFDDGPTTRAPEELLAAASRASPPPPAAPPPPRSKSGPQPMAARPPSGPQPATRPPSGPHFPVPQSQLATVHATTSPHNETMASNAPPPTPPPTASPDHITLRPQLPTPTQEARLGANHQPLVSSPTAATAGAIMPPPLAPEATRISGEPGQGPAAPSPPPSAPYGPARATARHETWIPPSRWRRVLVAGSAAIAVAAVALTIGLWPAPESPGTAAGAPTGTAAAPATLIIDLDAPGDIAVDGKSQPRGQSATVTVQPGVEHEVTVQSPGHAARRLHVPALAPGERMPLRVSLRQL
jgi:hypothetical protein